jgi:hypothetical protein
MQDTPGRKGAQQSPVLEVLDRGQDARDRALGAGEVRVALRQRPDRDEQCA